MYERCVRATLDSGTTTAAYFATIHRDILHTLELLGEVHLFFAYMSAEGGSANVGGKDSVYFTTPSNHGTNFPKAGPDTGFFQGVATF